MITGEMSLPMLPVGHQLQVIHVHAGLGAADVVKLLAVGDLTVRVDPGGAMS